MYFPKEASQRTLDLSEYYSDILDAFVEYMYYFDYDSSIEKHYPTEEGLLEFHVQMCVIADKYDMQPLKALAVKKFKAALDNTNSTDDLADAARCAYDASPATEEIREQIVKKAAKDPLVGVNAAPKTTLEDVMMKYPEFAVTVAKAACGFVYPTTSSSKREARWNLFECQAAARCGYTGRQSVFVDYPVPNCPRCGRLFAPVDKAESS